MRAGGKRRLVIPPSKAYGDNRSGSIPPNCTLLFEVDLLRGRVSAQGVRCQRPSVRRMPPTTEVMRSSIEPSPTSRLAPLSERRDTSP